MLTKVKFTEKLRKGLKGIYGNGFNKVPIWLCVARSAVL